MTRKFSGKHVAYHEAGHVVAFIYYGFEFDSVNLKIDSDISGTVKEGNREYLKKFPKESATIYLAGGAAECKLRRRGLYKAGMSSDILNAIDLVGRDYSHICMDNARHIINQNWSVIQIIAKALLEKKTLTYDEVLKLMEI